MRCRKPGCSRVSVYSLLTFPAKMPRMQTKPKQKENQNTAPWQKRWANRRLSIWLPLFIPRLLVHSTAANRRTQSPVQHNIYCWETDVLQWRAKRELKSVLYTDWFKSAVKADLRGVGRKSKSTYFRPCWPPCCLNTRRYRKPETSDNKLMLWWNHTAGLSWVTPETIATVVISIIIYQQNYKKTSHLHANFSVK